MHFYRTELPEDYVDLTGDDKLHFYRIELPKYNVDLTGEDKLHRAGLLQERTNCILTEQNSPNNIRSFREDKLHYYRENIPKDNVDLTAKD